MRALNTELNDYKNRIDANNKESEGFRQRINKLMG